jgi:hypothetical protein
MLKVGDFFEKDTNKRFRFASPIWRVVQDFIWKKVNGRARKLTFSVIEKEREKARSFNFRGKSRKGWWVCDTPRKFDFFDWFNQHLLRILRIFRIFLVF